MKDEGYTDPALEEIWTMREKLAAEFGYDLERLGEYFVAEQEKYGDRVVQAPPASAKKVDRPAA